MQDRRLRRQFDAIIRQTDDVSITVTHRAVVAVAVMTMTFNDDVERCSCSAYH